MGTYFALVNQQLHTPYLPSRRKIDSKVRMQAQAGRLVLSPFALSVSLIIFLACLVLAYLVLVNTRSTRGFEIKSLESRIFELESQQHDLEQKAADLQSIQRIQSSLDIESYVTVDSVDYMQIPDFALHTGR